MYLPFDYLQLFEKYSTMLRIRTGTVNMVIFARVYNMRIVPKLRKN